MRRLVLLFLPFSIACGISEENFASKAAELYCEQAENCGNLEIWGDFDTCVVDIEASVLAEVEGNNCNYDPGLARDCIGELKDAREDCDASPNTDEGSACAQYCGGEEG